MLKQLQTTASERLLKTASKKLKREPVFQNFTCAKEVGVLFCAAKADNIYEALRELKTFLEKKRIKAHFIGYYPEKEIPSDIHSEPNQVIFSKKELNWYGKPYPYEAKRFINNEFDLLIDLSEKKYFPLHYIASLSKAKFRVGRVMYPDDPYDFILYSTQSCNAKEYLKQLITYLDNINLTPKKKLR